MKKSTPAQAKIMFVVFCCFACTMASVKAQTFSILPANTQTMTLVCDSTMTSTIFIKNPTASDIGLSYEVVSNTLPSSSFWDYQHCDWEACFSDLPTGIKDVATKIPAGTQNQTFILDVNSKQFSASGSLVLKFYETTNPVNAVTVIWNISGCSALGIVEHVNNASFIVSPNPAQDFVNVEITSGYYKTGSIQVYNFVGDKLMEFNGIKNNVQKIDLTTLPVGAYFVKYNNEEGALVKKIFKTR